MNELIQMITDGKVLIVPVIGAIVFGIKCLVSSEIDLVFYSRSKQLITRLVKWLFVMVYFGGIYFAIAVSTLNNDIQLKPWVKGVNAICCIVIVVAFILLFVLYLLGLSSSKRKQAMAVGKGFVIGNLLCIVACVTSAVALGIEEVLLFCGMPTDTSLAAICAIVIAIVLLQTACMYLYIEWFRYICPIHIYVELNVKDEDLVPERNEIGDKHKKKQILYPLYETGNDMLMCKIKSDKKEDLYIRISKDKLKNVPIHVMHGDNSAKVEKMDSQEGS